MEEKEATAKLPPNASMNQTNICLHCNKYLSDLPKVTKKKVGTSPLAPLFR